MVGCLVQIDNDGKSCHEEQCQNYKELLCSLPVLSYLPEQSHQTQYKWEAVEYVVSLTCPCIGKQIVVSSYEFAVNEVETGNPVSVFFLSVRKTEHPPFL